MLPRESWAHFFDGNLIIIIKKTHPQEIKMHVISTMHGNSKLSFVKLLGSHM